MAVGKQRLVSGPLMQETQPAAHSPASGVAAERVLGRAEAPESYSYRRSQASSAGPRHPPEALPRWGLCFLHFFWEPRFRKSQRGYFFLEGLNFEFCVDLKVSRSQVLRRRFAEATVIPTAGSSEPEWSIPGKGVWPKPAPLAGVRDLGLWGLVFLGDT